MTPQDDWLPEERAEQHAHLIALLQRAYRASVAIPPERQVQIEARVYERLHRADAEPPREQARPGQLTEGIAASPRGVVSPSARSSRRRGRLIPLSTLLAAVLVIGVLVGTTLLLSLSRPHTTGAPPPPMGPLGKPVTIHTQAGGLEATMQITPGPYFLGEVIAADLSVTNHTRSTFLMEDQFRGNPCYTGELGIMLTGGGSPHYTSPLADKPLSVLAYGWEHLNGCPPLLPMQHVQWKPGQTIPTHQYLVLTSSGQVTLAAGGTFLTIVHDNAGHIGNYIVSTSGPLDGHWPLLRIDVQSRVPPDRTLSLKRQGEQVFVTAPLAARNHLLYASSMNCTYSEGSFTGGASVIWTPLSTIVLHRVPCSDINVNGRSYPGKFVLWEYAISAPGYAIAWGSEPS